MIIKKRGDKCHPGRGKRVKIPLSPNNVGKKSANDAGPEQGHDKMVPVFRSSLYSYLPKNHLNTKLLTCLSKMKTHFAFVAVLKNQTLVL